MVQALTFIHDPRLFALISLYEARITRNMQANLKMLFHIQSLPKPENRQREEIAAPEIARAASGEFVLTSTPKAA